MYPHFFDGAKKRRYPPKKRFPTPAVCSRKRCPLHKGTKTLHRKNGGSDSRPPSFRPTAVFILHLPPGYLRLDLAGWDYNPSVAVGDTSLCTREAALRVNWESLFRHLLRKCHLPLKGKAERLNLAGWDYNPSVAVGDTSLCTREAIPPGCLEIPLPSFASQMPPSPLGRLIRSVGCGGGIPPVLTKGQNHPPLTRGAIASAGCGGTLPLHKGANIKFPR